MYIFKLANFPGVSFPRPFGLIAPEIPQLQNYLPFVILPYMSGATLAHEMSLGSPSLLGEKKI